MDINRLNIGDKKWDAYYTTRPNYGGGIIYDFNDRWSAYGGASYSGGFRRSGRLEPYAGFEYRPSCNVI